MKSVRTKAEKWLRRVAGGFGPSRPAAASSPSTSVLNVIWIISLVIVVTITVSTVHLSSDTKVVQLLLATLWGLFVGVTLLLFLPGKFLTTLVGGILGAGTSDLAGISEVIKKMASAIVAIVSTLNSSMQGTVTIYTASCWIFLVLILICCIPAYRLND